MQFEKHIQLSLVTCQLSIIFFQRFDLVRRQVTPLARLEVAEGQTAFGDALEAGDRQAGGLSHAPDLPVSSLVDGDFQFADAVTLPQTLCRRFVRQSL